MARANCMYCGAALSAEVQEAAAVAAKRVLQTKNLASLEAVARTAGRETQPRRYVVIDTAANPVETIAEGCGVSVWEARQWQAASRYRLLRISSEPSDGALETGLRAKALRVLAIPEETIVRARNPIPVESIDPTLSPAPCTIREDPEAPPVKTSLVEPDIALIVSATIRREKVKEQASRGGTPGEGRLEDGWLVHFHFRGGTRPWEIDPRKTTYEGAGLASAYMRTLELVRRLSTRVPHDEAFKNTVPALSPSTDSLIDLKSFGPSAPGRKNKEPKVVILDNVAQFREYSAWRGAVE
jgi:hypothetical protein